MKTLKLTKAPAPAEERGAILVALLGAIALLGGLYFAMTSGGGDVASSAADDVNKAMSTSIMGQADTVATGAGIVVTRGTTLNSLEMCDPQGNDLLSNAGSCTFSATATANVFSSAGGGATVPVPPPQAFTDSVAASAQKWQFSYAKLPSVGDPDAGQLVGSLVGLKSGYCEQLNSILFGPDRKLIQGDTNTTTAKFSGVDASNNGSAGSPHDLSAMSIVTASSSSGWTSTGLNGVTQACVKTNDGDFVFYRVLGTQ